MLGPAYGGGDAALPYIEIAHTDGGDDVVFTTTFATWQWTAVAFDTSDGTLWTYDTDVVTIDKDGVYRIEVKAIWNSTSADTRLLAIVEKDPLGVGSFAFMTSSSIFTSTDGSAASGYTSFTVTLAATDKLRVSTRRLSGTAPTSTEGGNGPIWRITKMD